MGAPIYVVVLQPLAVAYGPLAITIMGKGLIEGTFQIGAAGMPIWGIKNP